MYNSVIHVSYYNGLANWLEQNYSNCNIIFYTFLAMISHIRDK